MSSLERTPEELQTADGRIEAFVSRFGLPHLYLAYHAAFPIALTPDMLYRIWANFQHDEGETLLHIPWIAVADLLLSNLCEEVGHELYQMNLAVRDTLLGEMAAHPGLGSARIRKLADFLECYVDAEMQGMDANEQRLAQSQRVVAWAHQGKAAATKAAESIARSMKQHEQSPFEVARQGSLIQLIKPQLIAAGFENLVEYGQLTWTLVHGDEDGRAQATSSNIASSGIQVGDVVLNILQPITAPPIETQTDEADEVETPIDLPFSTPRLLAPFDFSEFIQSHAIALSAQHEDALLAIEAWRPNLESERVFLITGEEGSGKSTLAAHLAQQDWITAYHFCMLDDERTLEPYAFIESIGAQLQRLLLGEPLPTEVPLPEAGQSEITQQSRAQEVQEIVDSDFLRYTQESSKTQPTQTELPVDTEFFQELQAKAREIRGSKSQQTQAEPGDNDSPSDFDIRNLSLTDAFEMFITKPLAQIDSDVIVLIDGLDKAILQHPEMRDGSLMIPMLGLPSNVRLVVTGRPLPEMVEALRPLDITEYPLTASQSIIREYEWQFSSQQDRIQLLEQIGEYFSLDELHEMAFMLNIDYEELLGDTKSAQTRDLLDRVEFQGQLRELVAFLQQERPHATWIELALKTGVPCYDLMSLHNAMRGSFDSSELQDLAFELGVNYEELPGVDLQNKMRRLIILLRQQERLSELMAFLKQGRPHVNWAEMETVAGWAVAEYLERSGATAVAKVLLNVRTEPHTGAEIVYKLQEGEQAVVIGDEQDNWLPVRVSGIEEPVVATTTQRPISLNWPTTSKIITIHSSQGGVGKTQITANLGTILARSGLRVGIVETNVVAPGIYQLFNVHQSKFWLNDYLWGHCRITDAVGDVTDKARVAEGNGRLFLIPANPHPGEVARVLREGYDVGTLNDGIHAFVEEFALDVLLADSQSGLQEEVLLSLAISDAALIVLRGNRQELAATERLLEVVHKLDVPQVALAVNQLPLSFDTAQFKAEIESQFALPTVGLLPLAEELLNIQSDELFVIDYPDHPWSQALRQTAVSLGNLLSRGAQVDKQTVVEENLTLTDLLDQIKHEVERITDIDSHVTDLVIRDLDDGSRAIKNQNVRFAVHHLDRAIMDLRRSGSTIAQANIIPKLESALNLTKEELSPQ